MKTFEIVCVAAAIAFGGLPALAGDAPGAGPAPGGTAAKAAAKPADEVTRLERWKAFREHIEKLGKKEMLPEESPDGRPPSSNAIQGVLFRLSPELAAADDLLGKDVPDVAAARARLSKLAGSGDPYIGDAAKLLCARCDLAEKKHAEAAAGFEAILRSSRNLAAAEAHKGLALCYRGLGETTLEVLELRFVIGELPPEGSSDRAWAEGRLAEIRRDHPGPMKDSEKRMKDISGRLADAGEAPAAAGGQAKVEEILVKVAKLLEDEAKRCPNCGSKECKPCKKCGACTATGQCAGQCQGNGQGQGQGKGQGQGQAKGQGDGKGQGSPKGPGKAGGAEKSEVAKGRTPSTNLKESKASDADAWGNVNDRDVARSLQDLWGKVPPSYRKVVTQYFKDISGLEQEASPAPAAPPDPASPPASGR